MSRRIRHRDQDCPGRERPQHAERPQEKAAGVQAAAGRREATRSPSGWRQACLRCGKRPLGPAAHSPGHPGGRNKGILRWGVPSSPRSLGLGANQLDCALPSFCHVSSGAITQFGRGQCLGTRHLGGVKFDHPLPMSVQRKRQAAGGI